ncbi:MAG: PhzF family phenazine biosynthesis protein, partial [Vicinamibacterales bacterium]
MRTFEFETVDVFTATRFGGNPLAVFPAAEGLTDAEMQRLAAEFNLSETTFVLPPADPDHTARVRIFNRSHEMPFAGHPMVGTAFVLAQRTAVAAEVFTFEVPAGQVAVRLLRDGGAVSGAEIEAPQPLATGVTLAPGDIAASIGLRPEDVLTAAHPPTFATVGNTYVIAETTPAALAAATPDLAAFRRVLATTPALGGRYSLYVYARRDAGSVEARMFAPLVGTWEDPATGSAATPLAALLLSIAGGDHLALDIHQGVRMGRPSLLRASAWRAADGVRARV